MSDNKIALAYAAIEKKYTATIPSFEEKENRGKGFVSYGEDNMIPEYLYSLYTDVSTLKTIITGTSDYVAGDDIVSHIPTLQKSVNMSGDGWKDLVTLLSKDYLLYGGFAIEVLRNKAGIISALEYVDFRYIRSDKDNNIFYYSEEYGKKYQKADRTIVLEKFNPLNTTQERSLLYVKCDRSSTYPTPIYSGAIKACEIERHIDEFHLSELENGFYGSYLFSFNNGIPEDEEKAEIERNINEKFCGSSNVGRVLISFSDDTENATTVEKLDVIDFADKYNAVATRSREQIYCAFGAVPQLFGLTSAATGFSEQEFNEAFKLYNRTKVRSIQRLIIDKINYIFSMDNAIEIKPYTISNDDNIDKTID